MREYFIDGIPYISKEQFCKLAHIRKANALKLIQSGLIPYIDIGNQTHRYLIRTLDLPPLISVPDLIETAKMELEWLCIQLSFLRIFLLSYKCKYATFSHIISMIIDILTFL